MYLGFFWSSFRVKFVVPYQWLSKATVNSLCEQEDKTAANGYETWAVFEVTPSWMQFASMIFSVQASHKADRSRTEAKQS